MADPTPYTVNYNFANFQANNPSTPLPGVQVDGELAEIAAKVQELIDAVKNIRRSDGALKNNIVTFDSLEEGLQLLTDPTNGQLVAAAVADAEAAATAASGSATTATTQAGIATTKAAEAAASASSVNLSLYLSKAGNLAGLGSVDTSRANLSAMKVDGSDATGRFAPYATGQSPSLTDWNDATQNGWYHGFNKANQPAYGGANDWLVHVLAFSSLYVVQTAYPFTLGVTSTAAVLPFRRVGYNNAGSIAWQAWDSVGALPIGTTIWVNSTSAPVGFLKENGALVSRTTYAQLWAYANASGNIVAEGSWSANSGAFSTGDLATTFRLPDSRGEFIRGYDDGRGVDSGRTVGSRQADSLKDHTHSYTYVPIAGANNNNGGGGGSFAAMSSSTTGGTTGSPSTGAAAETRPRNIPKLACIKAY